MEALSAMTRLLSGSGVGRGDLYPMAQAVARAKLQIVPACPPLDAARCRPQRRALAPEAAGPKEAPHSMSKTSETWDFLSFLLKLAVFVLVIRSFIISPFNIPSESMQPRLLIGD